MTLARLAVPSILLLGAACAGPSPSEEPVGALAPEQPSAVQVAEPEAPQAVAVEAAPAVEAPTVVAGSGDGSLLLVEGKPITNGRALVAGDSLFLLAEPFGPPPGFSAAELITWQDVLTELHVQGVEPARAVQLERLLDDAPFIDGNEISELVMKVSSGPGQWGSASWTRD